MKGPKYKYIPLIFIWLLLNATSCIEPFNPPATTETIDILVVDGFLNYTDSSAVVSLSKAVALADDEGPPPELNASVRIEDENGNLFPLEEKGNGAYSLQKMNLNSSTKYRLSITTSDNEEYISDYIQIKIAPPIDSIAWGKSRQSEALAIYVNTHDASNNTKYYQWTFEETWEYTAGHYSSYKVLEGEVVAQDKNIYQCWISKPSTEILIASSFQLSEDVIRNFQLISIPVGSQKISRKYSLEVQQRALPKEAYDFWEQLKKTTESLGSLFDPLPSQVTGNIKNKSDSSQPVLGYFSGGHVSKKRIFIDFSDLPDQLRKVTPQFCPVDTVDLQLLPITPNINLIGPDGYPIIKGWLTATGSNCLDCRDNGGNIVRPDFWE